MKIKYRAIFIWMDDILMYLIESSRSPWGGWLFTGKGMVTYSPSIVAASVKVLEDSATPDVQVTFAPGSFKNG